MDAYSQARIDMLPAFGPATMLMTPEGEIPVEWLATGDRLLTRDHGVLSVLWVGRIRVRDADVRRAPTLAPLEVAAHAFGPGCPSHKTWFNRAHRLLVDGPLVELNIGVGEALARVDDLAQRAAIHPTRGMATHYTQVLLSAHDMVQANGLWAETLHLDTTAVELVGAAVSPDILANPKVTKGHAQSARVMLEGWEVVALQAGMGERQEKLVAHIV